MEDLIKLEELVSFAKKGYYYIQTGGAITRIYSVNSGAPLTPITRNGHKVYTICVDDKYVVGDNNVKRLILSHILEGVYKDYTLPKDSFLFKINKGLYEDDNVKDYYASWSLGKDSVKIYVKSNKGHYVQYGNKRERYINNKKIGSISIRKFIFEYTDYLEKVNCSLIDQPNIVKYKYIKDNELKTITNTFTKEMIIPFKNICTLEGLCHLTVRYNVAKDKVIMQNKFSFEDKEFAYQLLKKYNHNIKLTFSREFNYHGIPSSFKYYKLFKYVNSNFKRIERQVDMYKDIYDLLAKGFNPSQIANKLSDREDKTEYNRIHARATRARIYFEMEEKF